MQRQDTDGVVIVCDFCRRDWDGVEAMIEGHLGSIICLSCLQKALDTQAPLSGKFKCTMCQRFNMPPEMPRYHSEVAPTEAIICQECLYQAAGAFSKNPDVEWKWQRENYPPAFKG